MARRKLFRTASFRLTLVYLLSFCVSVALLGAAVYHVVRSTVASDFTDRIVEETDALTRLDATTGRDALRATIAARTSGGGVFDYGLISPAGSLIAGNVKWPAGAARDLPSQWIETPEDDRLEDPEDGGPEVVRALATRLPDGAILVVGEERARSDRVLAGVAVAFAWAIGGVLALGLAGGLWVSSRYLRRTEAMRLAAQAIMRGDWSRRIELGRADDDISALARSFNRLFERIEKLLLANKHVGADIAHDLRKPLSRTLRRLETELDRVGSEAATKSVLEGAIGDIQEVLDTFDALLRIGQVEAGARRAGFRPVALADIAREIVEAFRPSAEESGHAILERYDAPFPLSGDRELLGQMFANLIDNALRYTPAGSRIEVRTEANAGLHRLTVADDGPGVAEDERAEIFTRFYRAKSSASAPGTGLGLSLVAAIADMHDLTCRALPNSPGLRIVIETTPEDFDAPP